MDSLWPEDDWLDPIWIRADLDEVLDGFPRLQASCVTFWWPEGWSDGLALEDTEGPDETEEPADTGELGSVW